MFDCPNSGFSDLASWVTAYSNENAGANFSVREPLSGTRREIVSQNVSNGNAYSDGNAHGEETSCAPSRGESCTVAVATTLHHSITSLTGSFWAYVKANDVGEASEVNRPMFALSDNSPVAAPLVQVSCGFAIFKSDNQSKSALRLPVSQLNNFANDSTDFQSNWMVDPALWNSTPPLNTNFTWIDLTEYKDIPSQYGRASLGALVNLPFVVNDVEQSDNEQASFLLPCTIDARWASVQISYDPINSDLIESNITNPSNFSLQQALSSFGNDSLSTQQSVLGISDPIAIDKAWADMFDLPGVIASINDNQNLSTTMMQALFLQFIVSHTTAAGSSPSTPNGSELNYFYPPFVGGNQYPYYGLAVCNTVETILSMVIAEGLSRSIFNSVSTYLITNDDPNNMSMILLDAPDSKMLKWWSLFPADRSQLALWTPFNFTIERYGYGYSYINSLTVKLGLAVLLIYVAIVVLYFIYSLWFWGLYHSKGERRGWLSEAWGDIGELLALALVSPEANPRRALGAVGAGVEKRATWRKMVRIDALRENKLALVVDENPLHHSRKRARGIVADKKYE